MLGYFKCYYTIILHFSTYFLISKVYSSPFSSTFTLYPLLLANLVIFSTATYAFTTTFIASLGLESIAFLVIITGSGQDLPLASTILAMNLTLLFLKFTVSFFYYRYGNY